MTKTEFFADQPVKGMLAHLRTLVSGAKPFMHCYQDRRSESRFACSSLYDAFTTYEWNGKDWHDNKQSLDGFRVALRDAVSRQDEDAAFDVAEQVLRWGGVWANNGAYLSSRRGLLIPEFTHMSTILGKDAEPSVQDIRRVAGEPSTEARMNAGFVKIYSVLLDHVVIYDGRVGAALGLLVRHFCIAENLATVPESLAFAWGSPKEGPTPKSRKLRNPSLGSLQFPRLRPHSRFHSAQAMRASWLLKAALEGQESPFSNGEDGFHELAAALFMIGYDLSGATTAVA